MFPNTFLRKANSIVIILILSAAALGCDGNEAGEAIPYDKLSGKLAFSRSGDKIAIIDASNETISLKQTKDKAVIWEASVSLSPDGKSIAYAAFHYTSLGYQIFTMPVNGGSHLRLTNTSHNFCPVWNASGTLYTIYMERQMQVRFM